MATKKPVTKAAAPTATTSRSSQAGSGGGAKSTKVVTDKGSHVTTVASSATATAGEPEVTTLEVAGPAARGDLGFEFKGVTVERVAKGGLAAKRGVRTGWVVVSVAGRAVSSENELAAALAAAKKAGKAYSVSFRASAASGSNQPEEVASQPAEAVAAEPAALPAVSKEEEEAAAAEAERRRKEEEEEAAKKRAAEEEQEARRRTEEEEALRKKREEEEAATAAERVEELAAQARRNGKARFRYEMYDQEFDIANGSLTQESIDEEFAFTFVMPGCHVHLSELSPTQMTAQKNQGVEPGYVMERPAGVYFGLETGKTYYCYVEQDAQQLKKDQDSNKARLANDSKAGGGGKKEDGRGFESCSCIYGAPCVDEYGCRDWTNRFAVAKKNGWKGF